MFWWPVVEQGGGPGLEDDDEDEAVLAAAAAAAAAAAMDAASRVSLNSASIKPSTHASSCAGQDTASHMMMAAVAMVLMASANANEWGLGRSAVGHTTVLTLTQSQIADEARLG